MSLSTTQTTLGMIRDLLGAVEALIPELRAADPAVDLSLQEFEADLRRRVPIYPSAAGLARELRLRLDPDVLAGIREDLDRQPTPTAEPRSWHDADIMP